MVPDVLFDEMEELYAPKDHPVFELTPPLFNQLAGNHYSNLGSPTVNSSSFWDVYTALLACFQSNAHLTLNSELDSILEDARQALETALNDNIDILPGLQPYSAPLIPSENVTDDDQPTLEADFTDSGPDSDAANLNDLSGNDSDESDEVTLEVDFSASIAG